MTMEDLPMNTIRFGAFVAPRAAELARLQDSIQIAEECGFDHVSVQDHPYNADLLDTFAVIGTLIGRTSRLTFMPSIANLPLRPPAILARSAAALDLLSAGRFELGLGGGGVRPHIVGMGGPDRSPGQVYESVEEAITVIRLLWHSDGPVDFTGRHYRLAGAPAGPAPTREIGIWLGAKGPRMLDLLGRAADGWIAPILTSFESKAPAQRRIDAAARAAGRSPRDIRRVIQLVGAVTDRAETTGRPMSGPGTQPIRTTPDRWAAIVADFYRGEGFDTVNFLPEDESPRQFQRFAEEVIPLARQAVLAPAH